MTSFINIINVLVPEYRISLWVPAFAADAAAVNLDSIKTLSIHGISIHFIKGKLVFSNRPKNLIKYQPYCTGLYISVFDNSTPNY